MVKKPVKQKKTAPLRKKAEKKLRQLTPKAVEKLSPKDSHQLIQELQVHQIELEMQNEELRIAQVELEESRVKYSDLYDFAPIGYLTTNKDGLINEINITGANHLGQERNKLIGKPFHLFIHTDFQDIYYMHRHDVMAGHARGSCEIKLKTKNKSEMHAQLISSAIKGNKGKPDFLRTALINITNRKYIEIQLLDAQVQLEDRVIERTAELKKTNEALSTEIQERKRISMELQEKNIALKVLLQQRDEDRVDMEQNIMSNIKSLVQPYLDKLKNSNSAKDELAYLHIIESNLNEIVSPFSNKLSSAYLNFSPREIQVANLIKEGRQDKDIMSFLNISFETVKTHRQNIRKKLGIYGKNTNLKTVLQTIIN